MTPLDWQQIRKTYPNLVKSDVSVLIGDTFVQVGCWHRPQQHY
jgi:hypothetical protein